MFQYDIYGCKVVSDRNLYLQQCSFEQTPDVTISTGTIPADLIRKLNALVPDANRQSSIFSFGSQCLCLVIPDGIIRIQNGNEIQISPVPDADIYSLASYIYCNCMSYIAKQRNWTVLHGSAIEKNGKAYLISGVSGSGKSTLTNLLLTQPGITFLSDDIAFIKDAGTPYVFSGEERQKLCLDVAGEPPYPPNSYLVNRETKLSIDRSDIFKRGSFPLSGIFCLTIDESETEHVTFQELQGHNKLMTLLTNCQYFIRVKDSDTINANTFQQCLQLAQCVPVYQISRPPVGHYSLEQMHAIYEYVFI